MKKQGIVQWIGTKQRHAVFAAGRDWEKTYLRTPLGATFICTMQLKETGGMLGKPAKPKTNISHARNGKVVEIAVELVGA